MLAGAPIHTAWATDLADEDTPRETRSEIETSVPLTSFQTEREIGMEGGREGEMGDRLQTLRELLSPFCPFQLSRSHDWPICLSVFLTDRYSVGELILHRGLPAVSLTVSASLQIPL